MIYNYHMFSEKHNKNLLKESIKNRTVTVFPKHYSNFPDKWDYFINFIDFGSQQPMPKSRQEEMEEGDDNSQFRKGLVAFWGYMTILIDRPQEDFFPGLEEIKSDLVSTFNKEPSGSLAIISLSSSEKKVERHEDETDNVYTQCVGSVTWRIYVGDSKEYTDYELNPGDVIFVPSGTSHEVFPNTPRSAIVFVFKKEDYIG
jgi:mannose-6-phosphate isomerase-like protein (cupin superfamily)